MAQKLLISFTSISAEILLNILHYSFCTECRILAHFLQMPLLQNHKKIICAKAPLFLAPQMLVK
jgi:hypothetical protein